MADATQEENTVLNKRVLASRSTDVEQCPSSELNPNQFDVQINDCGVVIVGSNNVVNVETSSGKQHQYGCEDEERNCGIKGAAENLQKKQYNRQGRKRQRCNPNYTTSSSGEDRREATLNERSLEIDGKTFQQALQTVHCCVNALRPLLLNGRWAEFERLAEEILLKDDAVSRPTREIIVVLEKSLAFCFRGNELEQAEDMMNNAVKNIEQTSGPVRFLLEVLSKCYLAPVYRMRKMFGKAEKCLEVGRKIASGFPTCLPRMLLLYELGSFKMEIASMFLGSRTEYSGATEGKKLLENCIVMRSRLAECEEICMYCHQVAISKIALMYLNCERSVSRNKDIVSQKNIKEGEKLLEALETEFDSSKESQLAKIQRLIVKVDLFYCRKKYNDAEKIAQETLELIESLGFKMEVTRLQARLTDIRRKITECSKNGTFRESVRIIASCSSTDNSAYSSEHAD